MGNKKKDPEQVVSTLAEDSLIKDTTISEKYRVFEISKKISKYLSGLLFASGALSILMAAEYFLGTKLLLASELRTLFLIVLIFIAAVNLICGLLLLAKE